MAEQKSETIQQKLLKIQAELKAPKGQRNNFGNYNYRSAEDILEAVKPLLVKNGVLLTLSDRLITNGDRYHVMATATLTDGVDTISSDGYAREEETKKGMDGSQITGASSSYARKYAMNGLFLIDDNKDSDHTNDVSTGRKAPAAKAAAKPATSKKTTATAAKAATAEPEAKKETATAAKPATAKKPIDRDSNAFKGMVEWVAAYATGTIDDAIDSLGAKYDITDEVRGALKAQAFDKRSPELPK